MITKKLYAILLGFTLVFQAAAQTKAPEAKRDALPAELKQDALKLLSKVAAEAQQFSLPENRVRAQLIVADVMWKDDEKEARQIFQNAYGELANLFNNLAVPELAELTTMEKATVYNRRYKLAEMRKDLVLTLAGHDPQAALGVLAALKPSPIDGYDPLTADELELKVTTAIVKKVPEKSYAVAKQQLDLNGLNRQFVETLKNLHEKDSKLAADLGRDVLAKMQSVKIRIPAAASSPGKTTPVNPKTEVEIWQISSFAAAAEQMNGRALRDRTKKIAPLLTEAEMRELVGLIANAFLAEPDPVSYALSQVLREIKRYAPVLAQRIRLKMGAEAWRQAEKVFESNAFYNESEEKTADELAKLADVSAPEVRDPRYMTAAVRAMQENDPEKAQTIAARIREPKNYAHLFEQIRAEIPLAKARRGDMMEVRKMLATFKTDEERVKNLTELAGALAAKGDLKTAENLLDEALQMMPPFIRKEEDLQAAARLAGVYAVAAPERAFSIVENAIGRMNDYINSSVKLDEFYSYGAVEGDELLFLSMNKPVLMYVPNSAELLKNLALADFERTVALADKFERPEIRLFVRLRIAEALLGAKAAEKKQRGGLVADDSEMS